MISRTILTVLVTLFKSGGVDAGATGGTGKLQTELPSLTLPWGIYQAQVLADDSNIYIFENVRFGAQPQRFSAPSFPSWTNSSIQPSSDGRNCIQIDITGLQKAPGGASPIDDPEDSNTETSEDCLFLDLYVPKSVFEEQGITLLPVVVWLYGGAYAFGSKNQMGPLYTGQAILRESNYQTIFIAGNYRVGAYGWLAGDYMQKVGQPNAGLYDQALLFEWVQKYIGAVKGDIGRVSAWGESAGAGSILHHLIREDGTKDPHFKTFAVQSPAFEWAWDNSPGGKLDMIYQNFSQLAGCGLSFDIDCLRSSNNLSAANQILFKKVRQTGLFPVGPAVDGKWIKSIPTLSFSNDKYWKGIDSTIVSHCLNETASFTPDGITSPEAFVAFLNVMLPGSKLAAQRDKIIKQYDCENKFAGDYTLCIATVIRDASFICNTRDLFGAYSSKSHMMRYGFPIPQLASHASDLVSLFPNDISEVTALLQKLGIHEDLAKLYANLLMGTNTSKAYQNYFASFAISGDPNTLEPPPVEGGAPRWTVATESGEYLANILTVQAPSGQPAFVLGTDDEIAKSSCTFWTSLAQDIISSQSLQVQSTAHHGEL
ncbi:hypothetical protein ACMFMG_005151 [Clarireedia jacksonii]